MVHIHDVRNNVQLLVVYIFVALNFLPDCCRHCRELFKGDGRSVCVGKCQSNFAQCRRLRTSNRRLGVPCRCHRVCSTQCSISRPFDGFTPTQIVAKRLPEVSGKHGAVGLNGVVHPRIGM
uniref:(northern house mosquito) hypothetical protein n=1 Tax=Culex pipiens TaxID=7175 RepID=A0A8D8B9D5_CULPI